MIIKRVTQYEDELYTSVLTLLPQLDSTIEPPSQEFFKELLGSGNIYFFVAEDEPGEIAGMLTLVSYPNLTGRKLWIEDVVVDASCRGKGVGEKLTMAAIEFARTLGSKEVKLTSRPSREAANRLYLKTGFVRYETNVYKYDLNH